MKYNLCVETGNFDVKERCFKENYIIIDYRHHFFFSHLYRNWSYGKVQVDTSKSRMYYKNSRERKMMGKTNTLLQILNVNIIDALVCTQSVDKSALQQVLFIIRLKALNSTASMKRSCFFCENDCSNAVSY